MSVFPSAPSRTSNERGLDPALVSATVARAHAAKLRVSAHIENAHDFHVAIAAGVDDIAHMPFVNSEKPESYLIAEEDLRAAAARGVSIATTLDWMDESANDRQVQIARDNLANMRRAGNTIVIGTDLFRETARVEAERIVSRHLMSNLELLQTWSIATPRAIFPQRKIGRLADGFEASFLVLAGDPLAEPANLEKIVMRVKQGHSLNPGDAKLPPLGE